MSVIRIFKEHHVALIIHNLIIYSMHRLINCKLYDVTYLSLTNCYLSDEEYTRVDLLSFTKLDLSKSILQELKIEYDVDLEGKKEVTHCVIRNSNITDKAAVLLASKVIRNDTLTHLELTHCNLQQAGLFNVINALEETSLLQDLILKSSVITNPVADKIANIIVKNSHLNSLNLSECNLQEGGLSNILKAMNKSSLFKIINFSCVNYHHSVNHSKDHQKRLDFQSSTCSFSLLPSVISGNQSVAHVDISNCNIKENDLANILENISLLESIKHLDVSGNVVTDVVAVYVAQAIRSNRDMELLNVSECCLSEHGLFTIFNALSDVSSLLHLDISLNRIFNTAAKKIINVLLLNRRLAHLRLHQCNLGSNDFIQIMSSVGDNKFITHLDIGHNHINQHAALIITTTILNKPILKYLDISFCKLTDDVIKMFANCLQKVLNLQHLNISHNNMSHSSAVSMALAIANNESLECLDLSECDLVDLRVVLLSLQQYSKVKCLIIKSSNFFEGEMFLQASDPPEVTSNSCMEYLDLSHCELSGSQMTTIARQLLQVSAMKYINISYNTLSDYAAIDITSVISKNPFFENINLSGCELSESKMISIVKALNSLSRLKHLDISQNKVTNEAANKVASVLANNPSLEHLNLSNCELSELCTTGIFKSLSKTKSFLMFLDISHNTITNNKSDKIASVVVSNPLLEHLNFSNCELSELQLISIFKALSKTSLLTFLDISHNEVTREAANEIGPAIVRNKSLQYLNLGSCILSENSLILVTDSLLNTTSLLSLDVSHNWITEKAAQSMAVFLKKNTGLQHLNFCACFVGDAILTVTDTISQYYVIKHLNFSSNVFTFDAAKLLGSILMLNKYIECLDLGHCNLNEYGLIEILNSLTNITTLLYLNLESNIISGKLADGIASVIYKNVSLNYLNFSNCNMLESEMKTIFHGIKQISSVEQLNISGNIIAIQTHGDLKDIISKNNEIGYLNFSGCKINQKGLYNILTPLTAFKRLKFLSLASCHISNYLARGLLPIVISSNASLNHLDLTDCKLQEAGLMALAKSLQTTHSCRLKSLILSSNVISNTAAYEIALVVKKNYFLQKLALSDCNIEETGLEAIAESLCSINNASLKYLDLSYNVITNAAAISSVANNTKLQHLDLKFCTWRCTGNALISMLKPFDGNNNNLATLDLSHEQMNLNTIIQIAQIMRDSTKLQQLRLCKNLKNANTCFAELEFVIDVILSTNSKLSELIINDINLRPRTKSISKIISKNDECFSLQHLYIANEFPLYLSNHYMFRENFVKCLQADDKKVIQVDEKCPFDHAEIFTHYVDHKGGVYYYKDHDIALFIPPGAILQNHCIEIKVSSSLYASFHIPQDYDRISSYVWVSANYTFKIPVYLIINHFLDIRTVRNIKTLSAFEACRIKNGGHVIEMHEISTGYFDNILQYCVISTDHFCTYCLVNLEKDKSFHIQKKKFAARYYTYKEDEFQDCVSYVAEICCTYLNKNCIKVHKTCI